MTWTGSEDFLAEVGYTIQNDADGLAIRIRPQYAKFNSGLMRLEESMIRITTTQPHLGGDRHWFMCPVMRDGKNCGRRVGRLYLPPGAGVFGCRVCHNLTYKSAREHHKRKHAVVPDLDVLLASLRSRNPQRVRLGLAAWAEHRR